MRLLQRLRMRPDGIEVVEPAVELGLVLAPQGAEGADALGEGEVALRPGDVRAVVGELLLVPARPDTELEPAARQSVDTDFAKSNRSCSSGSATPVPISNR